MVSLSLAADRRCSVIDFVVYAAFTLFILQPGKADELNGSAFHGIESPYLSNIVAPPPLAV